MALRPRRSQRDEGGGGLVGLRAVTMPQPRASVVATAFAAAASRPRRSTNCGRASRSTSPSVSARIVAVRGSSMRSASSPT